MKIVQKLRQSPFAFPLVALVALLLLLISETSYHRAVGSLDHLGKMSATRINNNQLLYSMTEAESAQRGFLLTRRVDYLRPYDSAVATVRGVMVQLRDSYANDASQSGAFRDLETQVNRKLSELQTSLDLYNQGKVEPALELLLTDIGKEQMAAIREGANRLTAYESQKIATERAEVYATLWLSRIGVGAMTTLSVLAMLMYLRQTAALDAQRTLQQQLVQAERDQLERQVHERTADLTELARHLQTAREDERSRLARDLHDELGALLTAAKLDVARLKSRLPEISEEATARLVHLNETLNSGIALKRRIIEDLRPSSLSNLGLVAALDIHAREFSESAGLPVHTELQPLKLSASAELTIYRLVQEALTNIAKYARASSVHIRLVESDGQAEVSVQDNGQGFDTSRPRASAHGLLGMRYRVEADGGEMQLASSAGQGTRVSARLPLRPNPTLAEPAEAIPTP